MIILLRPAKMVVVETRILGSAFLIAEEESKVENKRIIRKASLRDLEMLQNRTSRFFVETSDGNYFRIGWRSFRKAEEGEVFALPRVSHVRSLIPASSYLVPSATMSGAWHQAETAKEGPNWLAFFDADGRKFVINVFFNVAKSQWGFANLQSEDYCDFCGRVHGDTKYCAFLQDESVQDAVGKQLLRNDKFWEQAEETFRKWRLKMTLFGKNKKGVRDEKSFLGRHEKAH